MLQLNFSLFPSINTNRLQLRRIVVQDDEALFALRTDEQANKYLNHAKPINVAQMHDLVTKFDEGIDNNTAIIWAICLQSNLAALIGTISFHKIDTTNYRAEIGYMLLPNYWRKGIVSEAMKAVLNFGFEQLSLHSVEANINPANEASKNILLKHGFVKEAYFKQNYYYNGTFLDSEIYSLLKTS